MKRITAFILVVALCLGLLPGAALAATPFTDVPAGAYYEDAVEWAVANGITTGTSATTFGPDKTCTRAQAVTFLWRAEGSPAPVNTQMPFEDVPEGAYFYNAVLWALENNITTGTSATTFRPDSYCTRAQIVTFLWRTQGKPTVTAENPFEDVPADEYYTMPVLWAVANNITTGTSATTFRPGNHCTRAQIVTFLFRCLGEGAEDPEPEALAITQQPQDVTCKVGEEVNLQVEVTGGQQPYTYQWQARWDGDDAYVDITVDDSSIYTGWNEAILSFAASRADFDYHYAYRCVITDAAGNQVTSESAKLSEITPLMIISEPTNGYADRNVTDGAKFSVTVAGGAAPYTYNWQWTNKTALGDGAIEESEWVEFTDAMWWGPATNFTTEATTQTVYMTRTEYGDTLFFRCVITDAQGTVVSSDRVSFGPALKIAQQPKNCTIVDGSGSFTVSATGGADGYTYQWQYKTAEMDDYADVTIGLSFCSDFDRTTLKLANMSAAEQKKDYRFRCVVHDQDGNAVTSNSARAEILSALSVWNEPETVYGEVGTEYIFRVKGKNGTGTYSYQWLYDKPSANLSSMPLAEADWALVTNGEAIITPPDGAWFNNEYSIYCIVSDGQETYRTQSFSVKQMLTIVTDLETVTVELGGDAVFCIAVCGGELISSSNGDRYKFEWQWAPLSDPENWSTYHMGVRSDFRTAYELKLPDLEGEEYDYWYRCVVTDAMGTAVISNEVRILKP